MTKIKIKQLIALAEKVKDIDPDLSRQLHSLVLGAQNRPHPGRLKVSGEFGSAISKVIAAIGPEHVLVGGMAIRYHVKTRVTDDLDFAIMVGSSEVRKLLPGGKMGHLAYSVEVDGVDVDFLFASDFPWTGEAIQKAIDGSAVFHAPIKVAAPEYLILWKLEAGREQDMSDIKALLRLDGVADRTHATVKKYLEYLSEDLEQLIEESKLGL